MVLELLAEKDIQVNLLWLMFVPRCSFLDHFAYMQPAATFVANFVMCV